MRLYRFTSHDGIEWIRGEFGVPEVWIPNGEKGGNGGRADGSYVTEFSHEPLRLGDELVHYYGCSSLGKSPDGFVSVDSAICRRRSRPRPRGWARVPVQPSRRA